MTRCSRCGMQEESSIHQTNSSNTEIRMAAHPFEDNYVAFLLFKTAPNGESVLSICDSDAPGAFKVYRAREI